MTMRPLHWLARYAAVPAALVAASAMALHAQANLSTQGFGYPTGQFSTRAQGTDGAIGEMDPLSPINPATISAFGTRLLFFQIEPEYRTVTTASGSEHTSIARYPNVFGAMPVARNLVLSFGASTFLDRTSTTIFQTTQFLPGGDSVPISTTDRIDGAMDDLRLAAGWAPTKWLRLGLGGHEIVGHNLIALTEAFADTVQFAKFTQTRVLAFNGAAASAGFQLISSWFVASGSMRQGGVLHMTAEDTVLSAARVPNRYGGSLAFTGIPNSSFAIRTSHDDWSALKGLGSTNVVGVDTWDTSVGADVAGPKFGDRVISLRGGYRNRTLPFETLGQKVTETSFSGGLGSAFANGHVLGDLAIIRENRSAGSVPATEHAWTISFGLTVQP
jgi:hypothetical protein